MSRIILGIIHIFEKMMDRRMLRDLYPVRIYRRRMAIATMAGLVALVASAYIMYPGQARNWVHAWIASIAGETAIVVATVDLTADDVGTARDPDTLVLPEAALVQAGNLYHRCGERLSVTILARRYYSFSNIYKPDDLARALVAANPTGIRKEYCQPDALVKIPDAIFKKIQNRPLGWPIDKAVRAIYLQGGNVQPGRLSREVSLMQARDMNGLVFDVKDIIGVVNYRSSVPEVEEYRQHAPPIRNINKTIKYLHGEGIYVIARMALFQDANLATIRPELAIKDRNSKDGRLKVKGKPLWVDPGQPAVRSYNLKIVEELVEMGVDEIQFDYIRYPAEGKLSGVSYHKVTKPSHKTDHLVRFLSQAWVRTRNTGVRTSIDIFGIVAWGEEVDIRATGQRIAYLAPFVDIISPMLYPSHFSKGFDGFSSPADQGYHFYNMGVRKVLEHSKSNPDLVVRPWLQAFPWRVKNFNENYIQQQIVGNHVGGGRGWLMWNAGNRYSIVYNALRGGASRRQRSKYR